MKLEKLRDHFEESEHEIVLRTPVAWHRKRGVVFLLAIPFLALLCGGLCGGGLYDELGQGSSDAWFIGLLVGLPALMLAIGGVIAGVVRLLRASALSERSEVRIDLRGRVVRSVEAGEVPLGRITGLELVQPSKLIQWRAIQAKVSGEAVDSQNPYQASSVQTLTLLKDLEPVNAAEAVRIMERVGERISRPTHAAPEMTQSPQANDRTAVSCHIPVQMLWAIISAINLKNSNPLVRYHARLSLLLGGLHVASTLLLAVLMGLLGAVLGDAGFAVGGLLLMAGLFLLFGLRMLGMYKAWKKEYWQPPVFKGLTARWLPEESERPQA